MSTRGTTSRTAESQGRIVTENPALLALLTPASEQENLASSPTTEQLLSGPTTINVSDSQAYSQLSC